MTVILSDLAGSTAMQEALDPESVRRIMARSGWDRSTDLRIEVDEVLAVGDHGLAVRMRWTGHDSGGAALELGVGQVVTLEGGRLRSVDQYDSGDRGAMLARFAELVSPR